MVFNVKFQWRQEVFDRMSFPDNSTLADLVVAARVLVKKDNIALYYKDSDGDVVRMRNDDESIAHVREVANNEGVIRIIVRPSGVDDTLGAAPMNPDIVFQTKAFVKRMTANDVKEPKRSEQDLHDAAEAFKERQRLTREIAESLMIDQNTIDIDKFEAYCSLQQTPEEIEFAQLPTAIIDSIKHPYITNKVINTAIDEEEWRCRLLFLSLSFHEVKMNSHILIDVHDEDKFKTFVHRALDAGEVIDESRLSQCPEAKLKLYEPGAPSVVTRDKFIENFETYTHGMLTGFDYTNIVLAGGCVLGSLRGDLESYDSGDVDIFFVGLTTKDELFERVRRIYEHVKRVCGQEPLIVRTRNAFTFIPGAPYRHMQLILRNYESPLEVLSYFDLDCVACCFDGARVYASPRCRRSLNTNINVCDRHQFRSARAESRFMKYMNRGFGFRVRDYCTHWPPCEIGPLPSSITRQMEFINDRVEDGLLYEDCYLPVGKSIAEVRDYILNPPPRTDTRRPPPVQVIQYHGFDLVTALGDAQIDTEFRDRYRQDRYSSKYLPHCYMCNTLLTREETGLCTSCVTLNKIKKVMTAPLSGLVALITGGRIKIGHDVSLRLLRNGARVIMTTRFPHDAARRYAAEPDSGDWSDRLHIYGLDMRDIKGVAAFIDHVNKHYDRLDILINNAAQTIKRPAAYYADIITRENLQLETHESKLVKAIGASPAQGLILAAPSNHTWDLVSSDDNKPEYFPIDRLDIHGELVDLRPVTSWNAPVEKIPLTEMLEVQLINNVVPSMLINGLISKMKVEDASLPFKFVINVSSAEASFSVKKSSRHPHTNSAKAALNMTTRTLADYLLRCGVVIVSVDPGWISYMPPLVTRSQDEPEPPLSTEDGAARILDPVLTYFAYRVVPKHGVFLRNFVEAPW